MSPLLMGVLIVSYGLASCCVGVYIGAIEFGTKKIGADDGTTDMYPGTDEKGRFHVIKKKFPTTDLKPIGMATIVQDNPLDVFPNAEEDL